MEMPAIGLGTWQLRGQECVRTVQLALRLGYRHIDTAALYGNHAEIGEAIKGFDRKQLFITSKVWHGQLRYEDVLRSCDEALAELGTNYLDLYLIHWPNASVPMSETFRALERLHDEGKVRHIGVSNFTIEHLKEALRTTKLPLFCNQVEFHPMLYQKELLEFCKERKIALVAYSPLAHGRILDDPTVRAIARKHSKDPGQVSLRWILDKGVIAIPKASSEKHLKENLELHFTLDAKDTEELDQLQQVRFINPPFAEF